MSTLMRFLFAVLSIYFYPSSKHILTLGTCDKQQVPFPKRRKRVIFIVSLYFAIDFFEINNNIHIGSQIKF